jgi:hypothetical protein
LLVIHNPSYYFAVALAFSSELFINLFIYCTQRRKNKSEKRWRGPGKTLPFKAEWLGQVRLTWRLEAAFIHIPLGGAERRVDVVE